jgi:DNA-binding response OmpR family regulator
MTQNQTTHAPEAARLNYHILLIEDDASIARLIGANLQKIGLSYHHAADGEAGLFAFKQRTPDLVLLDLMLPDTNGYDICKRIRDGEDKRVSCVPIIMLTARGEIDDQLQGFKVGADDYVTKPFDPKSLVARVVAQLRRANRYNTSLETTSSTRSVPTDWRTCEKCNYMGPKERFEELTDSFVLRVTCPHCNARLTDEN